MGEWSMHAIESWDWGIGKRLVADTGQWRESFDYTEEPYVSPDGEKIAAIVKDPEETASTVRVNDTAWESSYDKIWYLRFSPDNRAVALVSDTGEWTVAVDGVPWENRFDYVWDTRFGDDGRNIIVAAQRGGKYLAVTNGIAWATEFLTLSNLAVSPDGGHVCAVVQQVPFSEGDIFTYQKGCYTLAVDSQR